MTTSRVLNVAQPVARPVGRNQAVVCRQVLASASDSPLRQCMHYAVWVYPRARTVVAT